MVQMDTVLVDAQFYCGSSEEDEPFDFVEDAEDNCDIKEVENSYEAEETLDRWMAMYMKTEEALSSLDHLESEYQLAHSKLISLNEMGNMANKNMFDFREMHDETMEEMNKQRRYFRKLLNPQASGYLSNKLRLAKDMEMDHLDDLKRINFIKAQVLPLEVMLKVKLEQKHILESDREFFTNLATDLLIKQDDARCEQLRSLKSSAKCLRVQSSQLRLQFSSVKASKNFLQFAHSVLLKVSDYATSNPSFAATNDSVFQNLLAASEKILMSNFCLPTSVLDAYPQLAILLKGIPLPWCNQHDIKNPRLQGWNLHWTGEYLPIGHRRKLDGLEETCGAVERAIVELESIKKIIKAGIREKSDEALLLEQQLLLIRKTAFLTHLDSII